MRRPAPTTWFSLAVVGGTVVFLLWQLHAPSLLLLNTLTAGGDTGAHVALPAFLKSNLLHHGRLTGWDPGWYDGFPLFTFYFPLPSLVVVLFNAVGIPYDIAFKLVTALGTVTLPVAAWAFGRLAGLRRPGPEVLALATVPYLFDQTFTIYGGNIASTLAGEYAFSLSLSAGLAFLGLFARGLRTGRHSGWAAVLLAVTGLCHLLPTVFVVVGAGVLLLMSFGRRQVRWSVPVMVTGGLLAAFWWFPFWRRLPYTTDMGWQRATNFVHTLFPSADLWVYPLAAAGAVLAVAARNRVGIFLTVMTLISAAGVRFAPQGKIWNARFVPFWMLGLYLLAGFLIGEGPRLLLTSLRPLRAGTAVLGVGRPGLASGGVALGAAVAVLAFIGMPLGAFPFLTGVFGDHAQSFVPDWIRWNYTGYQEKASWNEYNSLITTMESVGHTYGCGRAMWEYESQQNRFGTPEALMLLPYWTSGCIDSMEGLLFESASTTPYHFLDQSELSEAPSDAMLGLPYSGVDVSLGIAHLQMLGVRYYMTFSPQIQSQASANPALQLVATSGPWPVQYTTGTVQRTWDIYEIKDSPLVAPLTYEPAVVTNPVKKATQWLDTAVPWYQNPDRWPVPLAASGPAAWPRVPGDDLTPPRVAVPRAHISHITTADDRISFDVDRVGTPVVVRISYFPNWQATGAQGPYRITPNLMVVVPTSHHVTLHYGWTPVDGVGWAATLAGVAGVVVLSRRQPFPADPVPDPSSDAVFATGPDPDPDGAGAPEPQTVGVGSGGQSDP